MKPPLSLWVLEVPGGLDVGGQGILAPMVPHVLLMKHVASRAHLKSAAILKGCPGSQRQ